MNEDKRNDKYIQFPLCLMQETYRNRKAGLNLILDFGIVNYGMKLNFDISEVARQLLYNYFRRRELIQDCLYESIVDYYEKGFITIDEDYNGFHGNTFDPGDTTQEVINLFDKDTEFEKNAILNYQINQAAKLLSIKIGNIDRTIERFQKSNNFKDSFELNYGPDCWPSVKPQQIIEFRDSGSDLDLLRAFIAIKSLIGQKKYIATTRNVILMRMLGCKSKAATDDFVKVNAEAERVFLTYARSSKALRYHFDRLLENLLLKGFLTSKIFERRISRKLFLSVQLDYSELASAIIEFSQVKDYKKKENEAIERIRATI